MKKNPNCLQTIGPGHTVRRILLLLIYLTTNVFTRNAVKTKHPKANLKR